MDPPGDGLSLSANFDSIRNSISGELATGKYNALFIAASGLAKPLCVELAKTHKIKAIDFGAIFRALTYSATSGAATWPANHFPFYFNIPLATYLHALRKAYPEMNRQVVIAKANAQLMFDLIKKNYSYSTSRKNAQFASQNDPEYTTFLTSFELYKNTFNRGNNRKENSQIQDLYKWLYYSGYRSIVPVGRKLVINAIRIGSKFK
jgi:hypothetical protein